MANYTPSNLVNAQAILQGQFQAQELRFLDPVTFKSIIKNSSIMFPDHKVIRTREDRTVDAKYNLRTSRALGSARAAAHTGAKGDSATLTPSWTPRTDGFKTSLKTADNNVFSSEQMLANELSNVFANFAEGLETISTTFINTNRSAVNVATQEGTFNATNDVFEIALADIDRAVQIAKSVMHVNKHAGVLDIYCDTIAFNRFEQQAFQGSGNSTNLGFQFNGVNFIHSVELGALGVAVDVTYVNGYWLAVPVGSIGMLDWIPTQNRMGIVTKENMYGTVINPIDGLSYALHSYEEREDSAGTNGATQDVKTEWEISIDTAFEVAPDSTAGDTPLKAFALK